jgi:hypothetical protein
MATVQHRSRASKPAPRRYGSEANPFRLALPNQDTPEATSGRLWRVWPGVAYRNPLPARAYLAAGLPLRDVATILSTTPAELDLQLWNSLGETRA